ncbi:DUF1850 domain-containing protein [Variovorax dokdonensis]|uniref:DUF1850 domain-containing protein n=1 Tax=Variovorax dokdonensis TaxID=344883 RepID=A0ABT7NH53_9BURK|nr:DUF1850 domain-containing protein [Variovorax dokdonensis]MDM0047230.1 DUF1850 domain-containing protein [Variovorax dokdonensis]
MPVATVAALCMAAGTYAVRLPVDRFTLQWTHSIEKIEWDEDYRVAGHWLVITGARIRGSGAGMDPPPQARLDHGIWHYTLDDPWRKEVVLARSEFVPDYRLCMKGRCRPLSDWIPISAGPTTLTACTGTATSGR